VVLGGLSKEFAGGGLRFGFASTRSKALAQLFRSRVVSPPHSTLRYAAKKVIGALVRKDVSLLADLSEQRGLLRERAERLKGVLEKTGWKVPSTQGGLFLVAAPKAYLGKTVSHVTQDGTRQEWTLTATNLPRFLFETENILINDDVWTGIPGHCRFVLSTHKDAFERACAALVSFHAKFGSAGQDAGAGKN
jgi:methionine S-methyltransferase